MNLVIGSRKTFTVGKIALIASLAIVIALVQTSVFGSDARAASTGKITSCDTAIAQMNKTLVLIAKRRVAARVAKGKGVKQLRRAKRNLKNAQRQGMRIRSAIRTYCAGGSGVSTLDADCTFSIDTLAKTINLRYTRTLRYKRLRVKGNSKKARAKALKRKRAMKTQLKKLNEQVKWQSESFQKTCGGNAGNGGNGNGGNGGGGNGGGTSPADTTPPGPVVIVGPDGPTNDNTPTIDLSGGDGSGHYECKVNDGAYATVDTPYTLPALADGSYTITCRYVDGAGNPGPESSITITIDTTAPGAVTINGPAGPTNDNTPTIGLSGGDGTGHYECKINDGAYATVDTSYTLPALADGSYTITCRYVDGAGNPGPESSITITIDTTAPGAPSVNGPASPTNDNTPTYAISGGGESVSYQCKVDGGAFQTVPATYTTTALVDGTHTITCHATDVAGNVSPDTSVTVTVDTTPPGAVTMTGPSGATNDNTPTYTISGGGSGVTYQCKVDGGAFATVVSPFTTVPLADGGHTITCRAVDAAGNVGSETSKSVTVDTVAPGAVTLGGPSGLTNDDTPTYTISGGGSGVTYQCKVDGGAYATVTSPYTTATLGQGAHTVSCRAVDAAGNTGVATTAGITVDSIGPVVTIADGTPKWDGTHSFTLSANESGAGYQCKIDGGAYANVAASFTTGVLSNGTHTVTCRATDAAGNTGAQATKSFGVFKDPAVVSKSGGFQWGLGCTFSSGLNQLLGCPDVALTITIPANPNGLTGSYLADISGYINDISSLFGSSTTYTMNITVDGTSVASDSDTLRSSLCGGLYPIDLNAAKTNLSLSAASEHTITIRLKTSAAIDLLPSVGSSKLTVSIHH